MDRPATPTTGRRAVAVEDLLSGSPFADLVRLLRRRRVEIPAYLRALRATPVTAGPVEVRSLAMKGDTSEAVAP